MSERPTAPDGVQWRYVSDEWTYVEGYRYAWYVTGDSEPLLSLQHETRNGWASASKAEHRAFSACLRAPQGEPTQAGASADVEALVDQIAAVIQTAVRFEAWPGLSEDERRPWLDLARAIVKKVAALRSRAGVGEDERTLYHLRCGWCGAYEGEVDEGELCPASTEDDMHPHQFGIYERVARLSGDDQGGET